MLQIHNSLTGRKEKFVPLDPGQVRMYLCGDTVYDFCHVGHARSKVAFDIVRRYLAYLGYKVTFVRNITDIDDKIIRRAAENNESIQALTKRFIDAMHEDYDRLAILRPDAEPRATDHIAGIIVLTQTLIAKDYAYLGTNGDVMYSVSKFGPYGRLSGKKLGDLRAGSRVEVDEAKRDPLDFVLWKQAKPGEPSWPSPWGEGRPGWHIECSAMCHDILGTRFDIHAGGMDLKFPHHENEIAQSCAATDDTFAQVWMHNGFVNVDDEKMSKSLGNFFTIRAVLDSGYVRDPEVLRYFLASSHYRGPINYSLENIDQADAALSRIYGALRGVEVATALVASEATARFRKAMDDDFNTPEAIAVLQSLATEVNRAKSLGEAAKAGELAAELLGLAGVLGLLMQSPDGFLHKSRVVPRVEGDAGLTQASTAEHLSDPRIAEWVEKRIAARKARDFKEADRIRDWLVASGISLEDGPAGTIWRRQ